MEIPIAVCVFVWTVLLCLRADDTIFIDYHIVNVPMYFACAHLFVGLLLTDCWYYLNAQYATQVEFKVRCTMTLVAEEMVPITKRRKYSLYDFFFHFDLTNRYVVLAAFVAFFILLAEYLNEDGGLPESGAVLIA